MDSSELMETAERVEKLLRSDPSEASRVLLEIDDSFRVRVLALLTVGSIRSSENEEASEELSTEATEAIPSGQPTVRTRKLSASTVIATEDDVPPRSSPDLDPSLPTRHGQDSGDSPEQITQAPALSHDGPTDSQDNQVSSSSSGRDRETAQAHEQLSETPTQDNSETLASGKSDDHLDRLNWTPTPIGARVAARLIDNLLKSPMAIVMWLLVVFAEAHLAVTLIVLAAFAVVDYMYEVRLPLARGSTLGKLAVRSMIIDAADGSLPGKRQMTKRWLIANLPVFLPFALIWIPFSLLTAVTWVDTLGALIIFSWLLLVIAVLLYLGSIGWSLLMVFQSHTDPRGRTTHDRASGTAVVQRNDASPFGMTAQAR